VNRRTGIRYRFDRACQIWRECGVAASGLLSLMVMLGCGGHKSSAAPSRASLSAAINALTETARDTGMTMTAFAVRDTFVIGDTMLLGYLVRNYGPARELRMPSHFSKFTSSTVPVLRSLSGPRSGTESLARHRTYCCQEAASLVKSLTSRVATSELRLLRAVIDVSRSPVQAAIAPRWRTFPRAHRAENQHATRL
jgi:hypothetical protein